MRIYIYIYNKQEKNMWDMNETKKKYVYLFFDSVNILTSLQNHFYPKSLKKQQQQKLKKKKIHIKQ